MKQTSIFFILFILTAFPATSLVAQEKWTLSQCIEYALLHNIKVKEQKNETRKIEIERNTLKSDFLPDLKAGSTQKMDYGRSLNNNNTYDDRNAQSTSFSLSSEITLFSGLSRFQALAKNKYDLLASQEYERVIQNDLSLNVCNYYIEILLKKEILLIAERQVTLTKEQEQQTLLLIENGKVPEAQLYDVQAQLADDELTVTDAQNALQLSILELKQFMELEQDKYFDIETLHTDSITDNILPPNEIYTIALDCMPQIKQARYRLESNKKAITYAQSGYYPSLSFGAGISSGYYHTDNGVNAAFKEQLQNNLQKSIYLTLSIPLFNRFSTRNKIRTARVEADNARLGQDNQEKILYKEIEKAYTDLFSALRKHLATNKSVSANEEANRYAREKYMSGKSTVFEYNESRMKLANVLSEQAQSKYSYLLRNKILNFYTGQPLTGIN